MERVFWWTIFKGFSSKKKNLAAQSGRQLVNMFIDFFVVKSIWTR